jgi:hypothetical protein
MISRSFFYPDSPPPSELDLPEDPPSTDLAPSLPPPPPSSRHLDLLSLTAPVSSVVLDLDNYRPEPAPLTSHNLAAIAITKRPSQRRRSRLPALFARFSSSGPACEPAPSPQNERPSLLPPAHRYTAPGPRDNPGRQEPPSDDPPSLPSYSSNSSHVAQSQRAVHTPIPVPYSYTRQGSLPDSDTLTSTSSRPLRTLRHQHAISEHDFARKMHQTSSRLLRMTDDDRPYTRVRPYQLTR